MSGIIHKLDSLTIDKIAAGEVVDVPASCVKELVDNALDAGATDILVEIQLGGRELIRVTDNGCGMSREDVERSIERHATSKLRTVEDFDHLHSLGFRGEALAAIAAVSSLRIRSAMRLEEPLSPATLLEASAGAISAISQTRATAGTMVEVSSLFYNVPARRKFLKSPAQDTKEVSKVLVNLSLARPDVAFRLICDSRPLLAVAAEKDGRLMERARALLKEPFLGDGIEIVHSGEGIELEALVVSPQHSRSTRSGQHLIVNSRPVYSLPVSNAVRLGFGTCFDEGRHPLFVCALRVDPSLIDVNVHPQKREIRFANQEHVTSFVQEAISKALFGEKSASFRAEFMPAFSDTQQAVAPDAGMPCAFEAPVAMQQELSFAPDLSPVSCFSCLAVVGDIAIFHSTEGSEEQLSLLDVRQAMKAVIAKEKEQMSQPASEPLLLPISFTCSVHDEQLLRLHRSELEQLGFSVREFGPQSFLIESVPSCGFALDAEKLLFDILHDDLLGHKQINDAVCRRLAALEVGSMKELRSPISVSVAQRVHRRWRECGKPKFSPDGGTCMARLTQHCLREYLAKSQKEK